MVARGGEVEEVLSGGQFGTSVAWTLRKAMRSIASSDRVPTLGFDPSGATVATLESFGLEELNRSPSLTIQPSLPRMMGSRNMSGWTKRHVVVPS